MASLDKEIEVLMLRGERGYSSYEEAVANSLFSGTLQEWIETFATPDNYVTRLEFQKVTQAEYEALAEAGQLIPNCYYIITDDDTWETLQDIISRVGTLEGSMTNAQGRITNLEDTVLGLNFFVNTINEGLTTLNGKALYSRSLLNSDTDTDYHGIGYGYFEWTVNAPNVNNSEYLYILKGAVRYKSTVEGYYTTYDLTPFVFDAVNSPAYSEKKSTQYFILSGVGLIRIVATYSSRTLSIYARKINLTSFNEETVAGYFEFKVNSFKAVANWK